MSSCPETRRIRDYLSDKMGVEERLDFQEHLDRCPQCRRELRVETAIDLELAREIEAPDIEHAVLRALELNEPSPPFSWERGTIRFLFLAVLLAGFGSWFFTWLIRGPGLRLNAPWLSVQLQRLIEYVHGHPDYALGIGVAACAVSTLYILSRLRLLRNII